ncbi:MAG: CGNR zinc finger domain-containing protein [Actinobacteria bacterium]|nr:CGNR zinc finger domain-containing protein [Actinomycetota bacterium]
MTETEFLALLNSAPVIDGQIVEMLDDPRLIRVREDLRAVIRGEADAVGLSRHLRHARLRPAVTADGVAWELDAPPQDRGAAEAVLAWARVQEQLPGRLRACANPECRKFLIDHSKPNSARWCSMATCGNRMKARRHYARRLAEG